MALDKLLKSPFFKSIDGDLFLAYHGVISQDLIVGLGESLRSDLSMTHSFSYVNRVFAIFVEMIQNVLHYSISKKEVEDQAWGVGAILIFRANDSYNVVTVNPIYNVQKERLKEKFHFINALNEDQLKELYLKQRKQKQGEKTSKGAGLGFIDLIRKSGNPINYYFENTNDKTSCLFINTKIYHEQKAPVKV